MGCRFQAVGTRLATNAFDIRDNRQSISKRSVKKICFPQMHFDEQAVVLRNPPRNLSCTAAGGRKDLDTADSVRLYNVKVAIENDPGKDDMSLHHGIQSAIRTRLKLPKSFSLGTETVQIVRKAFDARKRDKKCWVYVVDVSVSVLKKSRPKEEPGKLEYISPCDTPKDILFDPCHHDARASTSETRQPTIVIGTGPAGLFAALKIASAGIPVIILERGKPVEARGKDIGALFVRKHLDPESNLCYGEGGAGTWSDGKLTTRIGRNDDPVRQVLNTLCALGAPEEILYTGKPHLGTDRLVKILQSFRRHLGDLGVQIHFSSKVKSLKIRNNSVKAVILSDDTEIKTDTCIMAVGHSARELYSHLDDNGVQMHEKPFAVGFRIEHPQSLIDAIQYGDKDAQNLVKRGKGSIPVADYRLTATDPKSQRGTYSFCMCPGGQIVPTSTTENELCINGMSFSRRNSIWANSALVTTVNVSDWSHLSSGNPALAGVAFQKHIESRAAMMGGGNFVCPVQRATDFMSDSISTGELPSSSYRLGVRSAPLHELYSESITEAIKYALLRFEKLKPGFLCDDALLHAAETRTSAPVQILRDAETFESVSVRGLYPCGEGAGYAGGIVSAAVDGIKVGNMVAQRSTFH